jgi:hypothetical protein
MMNEGPTGDRPTGTTGDRRSNHYRIERHSDSYIALVDCTVMSPQLHAKVGLSNCISEHTRDWEKRSSRNE